VSVTPCCAAAGSAPMVRARSSRRLARRIIDRLSL
jgi:hypothetical protein